MERLSEDLRCSADSLQPWLRLLPLSGPQFHHRWWNEQEITSFIYASSCCDYILRQLTDTKRWSQSKNDTQLWMWLFWVNRRGWNAVLGCSLKNDRIISVHFQDKPFNITVIQLYAPMSNAEKTEVEWFYEDLQNLRELTPKRCPSHYRWLQCKSRKSRDTWRNRQIGPWSTE